MASTQQLRFLILGEDPLILQSIQTTAALQKYGFEYLANTYQLLGKLKAGAFSGLIMPLDMPSINGLQIVSLLRGDIEMGNIAIFLTRNTQEDNSLYIQALELKDVIWLTHPLLPEELRVHLEHLEKTTLNPFSSNPQEDAAPLLKLGELEIDVHRYEFKLKNQPIQLTPIEFKLLKLFIERKGRIQTREHLLNTIWGYTSDIESRTIDTHVRRLREKLQDEAKRIQTVRGVGYKLLEDN
jgi:two-component system, OmpR family, phosphate regulon response regulator PhoB